MANLTVRGTERIYSEFISTKAAKAQAIKDMIADKFNKHGTLELVGHNPKKVIDKYFNFQHG